jgi:hypothetical protein
MIFNSWETIHPDIAQAVTPLLSHLKRKGRKVLGAGRHRTVFDCGLFVVKIPRNFSGMSANLEEHENSSCPYGAIQFARTRLIRVGTVPILLMQKVAMPATLEGLPAWTDFVDGQQVGYTKGGKLVAYDFGS